MIRVVLCRVEAVEHDALIADDSAGPVNRVRIHTTRIHVFFGACDEEGSRLMHCAQSCEVQIVPVHDVETVCLDKKNVQHIDIVQLAVAWNASPRTKRATVAIRIQLRFKTFLLLPVCFWCSDRRGQLVSRSGKVLHPQGAGAIVSVMQCSRETSHCSMSSPSRFQPPASANSATFAFNPLDIHLGQRFTAAPDGSMPSLAANLRTPQCRRP